MDGRVLEKVLEVIKDLQPAELQEVNRAINGLLQAASKEVEREAALRVLDDSGLIRQVKRPAMVASPRRPPVPIQGRPLSKTIIEERR